MLMANAAPMRLIAGTANPQLALEVSEHLGVALSECMTKSFADGVALSFTTTPAAICTSLTSCVPCPVQARCSFR